MNFDDQLLDAIGAWQKGWREDQEFRKSLSADLLNATQNLHDRFRTARGANCYRKRFLHQGELERLIMVA